MTTTSSHLPILRPTSRSVPAISNPTLRCRAMEASWPPTMRAITVWKPWALAVATSSSSSAADATAAALAPDVDGVLDGRAVGRTVPVGRERGEAQHRPVVVLGDEHGVGPGPLDQPGHLLLGGAGHEVEGDRRARDLGVVDGADGLGVLDRGASDLHDRASVPRGASAQVDLVAAGQIAVRSGSSARGLSAGRPRRARCGGWGRGSPPAR